MSEILDSGSVLKPCSSQISVPVTNKLPYGDGPPVSSSLNLDFYWEEAKRIEQECPDIAAKQVEDEQKDEVQDADLQDTQDRDGDIITTATEDMKDDFAHSNVITLSEAAGIIKYVAMWTSTVRKRRLSSQLRVEEQQENGLDTDEVRAMEREADERSGQAETGSLEDDPRDTNYLVLVSGDDSVVDDTVPLPEYRPRSQPTGMSYMDDFSAMDRDRLRHVALVEVTAIFERYNLPFRITRSNTRRRNTPTPTADSKVLGVPLTTLLERDQERVPQARCPVFVEEICHFLDEHALMDEGILRIPGNSARLKRLREELELGYDNGTFTWEERRTNDAATLLKQFLRELPVPLLSHEYLRAFATAEAIPNRRDQIGALNLLILLLPDVHRETLYVLLQQMKRITEHEAYNKMGLSNVAMIIAPNLFCQLGKMSRNADSEVQLAAGTSLVVRVMINYYNVLFIVPNSLVRQLREFNDSDIGQSRKARNFKDIRKVLTNQRKSSTTTVPRELPSPVVGKVSKNNHYVIKILSPEFPRISMILEINDRSRVCEVLTNFRRKQLGLMSPSPAKAVASSSKSSNSSNNNNNNDDDVSSISALDLSMIKGAHSLGTSLESNLVPGPSTIEMELTTKSSSPNSDSLTNRRHSSPVNPSSVADKNSGVGNEDMYECEGNIGSRRLRENALVMEILKENPTCSFYVRKRTPTGELSV